MWCPNAKFRIKLVLLMLAIPSAALATTSLAPSGSGAVPASSRSDAVRETAQPAGRDGLHLSNTERNDKLWALLQYESAYGKIEFHSLRKFGDYAGTNLRAVKAVGFHLSKFNFSKADMRGADLRSADLRGANFRGADLRESVLISANTEDAVFDSETRLPYSHEEALKRGWREVAR